MFTKEEREAIVNLNLHRFGGTATLMLQASFLHHKSTGLSKRKGVQRIELKLSVIK